jgi:hypothetical protein
MENSNQMIQGLLGTAKANPSGATALTNPSMQSISTNGKMIVEQLGNLTQALNTLTKTWGG